MTAKKLIEAAIGYSGISCAEFGRRMGWSPQNTVKRLSTGKFTVEEWLNIGRALGAETILTFRFPDGKEI